MGEHELRQEMLRLLREDEEFRLAVMGLLGIADVQSSLKDLITAVRDLINAINALRDAQNRQWDAIRELMNIDKDVLSMVKELIDISKGSSNMIRELIDITKELLSITKENSNLIKELINMMRELTNRVIGIENKVIGMENKVAEIEKGVTEIERRQEEQQKILNEVRRDVAGLRHDVGGLSVSVGKILERDIRHYLPMWIRDKLGIKIDRLRRLVIQGVFEVDGYAEVDDKVVVAEIKATLRFRDVNKFVNEVLPRVRSAVGGREVVAIVAYVNEGKDAAKAVDLARKFNIKVLKHHGEDEFEELA